MLASMLTACTFSKSALVEGVSLRTSDSVNIKGTYYKGSSNTGIIALHQLNNNKNSYDEFAAAASLKGYHVIAIDFRGHGESDGEWQDFNEEDFRNMENDAKAAYEFLNEKGISNFYVMGASIGANTAINFAQNNDFIKGAIALSPSYNYKGIDTREAIKDYSKKLMIVVAEEDEKSYDDSSKMGAGDLVVFDGNAHGTNMFTQTNLAERIFSWLEN